MIEVSWLVFCATSLVLIATPGQDMILVAGCALARTRCSGYIARAASSSSGSV
jgi:threonine/homoserine/homoserine lactone efflux protein